MSRYASTGAFPFPTRYDSSAFNLCMCILSCSEYIATDLIPNSVHALNTRIAISPFYKSNSFKTKMMIKFYNIDIYIFFLIY